MRAGEATFAIASTRAVFATLVAAIVIAASGCAGSRHVPESTVLVDDIPAVAELRVAREDSRVERVRATDGVEIAVRVFGDSQAGTPVVLVHGLQSHSGWFVQSAQFIARRGRPVYALDRRGSGLSTAPRGDCDDYGEMVEDIATVVRHVSARHGIARVHVLGHCFGAIPATLCAIRHAETVRSLILATPGFYTQSDLTLGEKLVVCWSTITGTERLVPVPLELDLFTDLTRYRSFIANDPLSLKEATTSFYYEIARARDALEDERSGLHTPVFLAMAEKDEICDNAGNREYVDSLPTPRKLVVEYQDALHILEFSVERDAFFSDLADWLAQSERNTRND